MVWMLTVGSLAFGGFVGGVSVWLLHAALERMGTTPPSLGDAVKNLGGFLASIVLGGGGGAAGLTFLADGWAAGAYLLGVFVGGLWMFVYLERRARGFGAKAAARSSREEQVRETLRGDRLGDDAEVAAMLDELSGLVRDRRRRSFRGWWARLWKR